MTDLEARYQMALEEILLMAADGNAYMAFALARRALDLSQNYYVERPQDFLGIHPSKDPRLHPELVRCI